MGFKIRKILTERQLRRCKFSLFMAIVVVIFTLGTGSVNTAQKYLKEDQKKNSLHAQYEPVQYDADENIIGGDYIVWEENKYDRGRIVYFSTNEVICNSSLLIPGTAILPNGLLAIFYGFTLIYLFLGIGIVSDVFMDGIEILTSQTKIITVKNSQGEIVKSRKVKVWNPTVANLTLMALGSSAPEILLSVIETAGNMGGCPGELGASTIVGSAAFNLLVISAVSIYAVNEKNDTDPERDDTVPKGVKKIYDMGVFGVTAFSSIFAYLWMWYCLMDQSVSAVEAWLTFIFFFVLIGSAFGMDKYKAMQVEKEKRLQLKEGEEAEDDNAPVIEYSPVEIYKELISEKQGVTAADDAVVEKRAKMKNFLKSSMKTDQIDRVSLEDLKKAVQGDSMLSRIKYRRAVGLGNKKKEIAKGEIIKQEHVQADHIDDKEKHEAFGFRCLHYSVSEASGSIRIHVLNKSGQAGQVRVVTEDQEAIAGDDYEAVDEVLKFEHGQKEKYIEVTINDDDNWEPDEDFFVQLKDPNTGENLLGRDTRTRVTIIDDDKPGQIGFEETKGIKALASEEFCDIVLLRKNGSDGIVTIDYKTVELDKDDHTATPGVDYEEASGTITFEQGVATQTIRIRIIPKDLKPNEQRDESFGIQLENITPAGAKLSKKSFNIVNIVTDVQGKKKAEALQQLMQKIEDEEETTWGSQFITACMLHPNKNEEGEIEDISGMDGFLHFATIGWKLFFSLIPPPHYGGGIFCFFISLAFIGFVTYVVGEFADLFGCVLNIKPSITAITFVALGTSLPDTFASMAAASAEKYADSAVGNVTGSNSVNVFLGLGLPWVIATIWEGTTLPKDKGYDQVAQGKAQGVNWSSSNYYVPAGSLGFSVAVFCICAVICVITLLIRRHKVGGELGGSDTGRAGSAIFLTCLWMFYIIMSILQAYKKFGLDKLTMGIQKVYNPNCKCNYASEKIQKDCAVIFARQNYNQ